MPIVSRVGCALNPGACTRLAHCGLCGGLYTVLSTLKPPPGLSLRGPRIRNSLFAMAAQDAGCSGRVRVLGRIANKPERCIARAKGAWCRRKHSLLVI